METAAALYYPHTTVQSKDLLKNALLLWDYVECITPRRLPPARASREVAAAAELVVRRRVPSVAERNAVHIKLQELLRDGVPRWMQRDVAPASLRKPYLMYPDKLADATWDMLEHANIAALDQSSGDYNVPPALGLFALSLLATQCAGKTRTRITDRERAYAWLIGVMTENLGGEYVSGLDGSQLATTYDRLITATVKIVNTDGIPMKRLIDLRTKEAAGKAPELQPLRAKYLKALNAHVKLLLTPDLPASDAAEIERQFARDMTTDFRELKRELGFAAKEALLSKEVGVTALAMAGAIAAPLLSPLLGPAAPASAPIAASLKSVGVGALYMTKEKYRKARAKVLGEKAMSWLYVSAKRRLL